MGEKERERAYRFDLFIAPDWSERFDELVTKHVKTPDTGRILEINCGTGSRAIAIASGLKEGEVIGVDESAERIAIAQAKARTVKVEHCSFEEGDAEHLRFEDESFDAVIADASLTPPSQLGAIAVEAVRVAREGASIGVTVTLRGSFDEFYSIYWEVLYEVGIVDDVWDSLETLITARPTRDEVLEALREAGMSDLSPHKRKEEFRFETGEEFLASPLVADLFLDDWLSIVPPDRLGQVRESIERVIDRERGGQYFYVSAKVLVATGRKRD
jgi:ubiquinone/menaquinone biosynthesis C-methylase UbiE